MPLENQGKPVDCPDIKDKGVNDRVVNYGTYIAGTGILHVNSDAPTNPLFQANIVPGSDVPLDLKSAGYRNCGVEYNPANGGVVCKYRSHCGHDPFTLGYILKNGLDGVVNSSSSEEIHINLQPSCWIEVKCNSHTMNRCCLFFACNSDFLCVN